jgi:hypothetical protein
VGHLELVAWSDIRNKSPPTATAKKNVKANRYE